MERTKFPKIGEVIKEFFLSLNFISNDKIRTRINRLAREKGVKLDEVKETIEEVFELNDCNTNNMLIYVENEEIYKYSKYILEIYQGHLINFIEAYKNEILRKLDDENETDEKLKNKFINIFEKFKENIINGILELSGFKYMNYQGDQKESYYYDQIKSKLLKDMDKDNFNYLNTALQNEEGDISEEYHLINGLGKNKNTDKIIKNTVKIFELESKNSLFLTLTIIMARFEKAFTYKNLKFQTINDFKIFDDYNKYLCIYAKEYKKQKKLLKESDKKGLKILNKEILKKIEEDILNYSYQSKVDIKPILREGIRFSSYSGAQIPYNFFYMYANYFGLILENRDESTWRFKSAKNNSKIVYKDNELTYIMSSMEDPLGRTPLIESLSDLKFSYRRALSILEESPNIEKSIDAKTERLKQTALTNLLDNCLEYNGFLENKELFIKVLEKLLKKGANPNLSGRPEENMPLALLIRLFNTDFYDNTKVQEQHIRKMNKGTFSRYDNSILDDDYRKIYGNPLEYKKYRDRRYDIFKEKQTFLLKNHKTDLLKCCKLLLDAGANLNLPLSKNKKTNLTLFHYIIEAGDLDLFNLALNYNINFDLTIKSSDGQELMLEHVPFAMNVHNETRPFNSEKNKVNRINMFNILLEKRMSQICK